jgi:hypothetical protein
MLFLKCLLAKNNYSRYFRRRLIKSAWYRPTENSSTKVYIKGTQYCEDRVRKVELRTENGDYFVHLLTVCLSLMGKALS